MSIKVSNVRHFRKTEKGHLLEIPIDSQNLSQLESDIVSFLWDKGYSSNSTVTKTSIEIKNIRDRGTSKRAPAHVYARMRQMIATGLENRNMRGQVTGGSS